MDISEQTTISQESFGLSPEMEQKMNSTVTSDSIGFLFSDATSKTIGSINSTSTTTTTANERKMASINSSLSNTTTSRTSNRKYSNADQHDNKFDDSSLDNRILINKNSLTNTTKQRVGMTLVDMHPLMVKSDDEDFSPDSSTFDSAGNQEFEFANTESESPMHVSPTQRFDALSLPKTNQIHNKSCLSSGESEPDISQYQASVELTFQSVSLANYNICKLDMSR